MSPRQRYCGCGRSAAFGLLRSNPIRDVGAEFIERDDSFIENRLIESFQIEAFA